MARTIRSATSIGPTRSSRCHPGPASWQTARGEHEQAHTRMNGHSIGAKEETVRMMNRNEEIEGDEFTSCRTWPQP